jgi:hypothetical protein
MVVFYAELPNMQNVISIELLKFNKLPPLIPTLISYCLFCEILIGGSSPSFSIDNSGEDSTRHDFLMRSSLAPEHWI